MLRFAPRLSWRDYLNDDGTPRGDLPQHTATCACCGRAHMLSEDCAAGSDRARNGLDTATVAKIHDGVHRTVAGSLEQLRGPHASSGSRICAGPVAITRS